MTDDPDEVVEEYPHDCRIVLEERDWYRDRYHFECRRGRMKNF